MRKRLSMISMLLVAAFTIGSPGHMSAFAATGDEIKVDSVNTEESESDGNLNTPEEEVNLLGGFAWLFYCRIHPCQTISFSVDAQLFQK